MIKLQVKQPKNQRIFFIIMAALFLPQGMMNIVENKSAFSLVLGILQLTLTVLYIPLALGGKWSWNDAAISPVLLLGAKAVSTKSWWTRNHSMAITEIEKVQVKPEQIAFIPKDGGETIYFTHMGPNSKEIIQELNKFCEEHNLAVEEIGYR